MTTKPHRPWRADRIVRGRARQLRRDMTPPERILWTALRDRQPADYRFRRQYPIGDFIVDFRCPAARLIVELDGDTHEDRLTQDQRRTSWLAEQKDYDVLRISNDQVLTNLDGVYDMIAAQLRAGPSANLVARAHGRRRVRRN